MNETATTPVSVPVPKLPPPVMFIVRVFHPRRANEVINSYAVCPEHQPHDAYARRGEGRWRDCQVITLRESTRGYRCEDCDEAEGCPF